MLVAGALGVEEEQMAHGSLLAIGGGLALALPTALTGLLDWLELPKGTSARTTATVHLVTMVTATLLFALAFVAQLDGYDNGRVESLGLAVGLAATGDPGGGRAGSRPRRTRAGGTRRHRTPVARRERSMNNASPARLYALVFASCS
jgi:hypothetical protein